MKALEIYWYDKCCDNVTFQEISVIRTFQEICVIRVLQVEGYQGKTNYKYIVFILRAKIYRSITSRSISRSIRTKESFTLTVTVSVNPHFIQHA